MKKDHFNLMIQGTASSAGKSIITTGLCRILKDMGYKVAPFKSQNMALNSYITKSGMEMGRAQVVQAEAAGIDPEVYMNPILLKPTGNGVSQVIVEGRSKGNMKTREYHEYKKELKNVIMKNYDYIKDNYDISIIEGAGSPVEINLMENDIVNMGMAKMADAPVILVADIDRGGVFASIVGTISLFSEEERERVKGVIINKFRGDKTLLQPGIDKLEEIIKKPVLGVVPYMEMNIEDEDGVTEKFDGREKDGEIKIAVIKLKHISNFTDLTPLENYPGVKLNYITKKEELGGYDMIVIPGSKNTIEDIMFLKKSGLEEMIIKSSRKGTLIFGICGGYQILGTKVEDPYEVEGKIKEISGLGLLDMITRMEKEKRTTQYKGKISSSSNKFLKGLDGIEIEGYEIHQGITIDSKEVEFLTAKKEKNSGGKENILGTYIHGIFENDKFRDGIINNLRKKKGLKEVEGIGSYSSSKEREYENLKLNLEEALDIKKIMEIITQKK